MKNKILIALIIIVLIILGGLIVFSSQTKLNTEINFLSASDLSDGDSVEFELKDSQGHALKNQNVKITFMDGEKNETFSIVTDNEGKGALVLSNENPGNYTINVNFDGNDRHNGCVANKIIFI